MPKKIEKIFSVRNMHMLLLSQMLAITNNDIFRACSLKKSLQKTCSFEI